MEENFKNKHSLSDSDDIIKDETPSPHSSSEVISDLFSYKCDLCDKTFARWSSLKKHTGKAHQRTRKNVTRHVKLVHEGGNNEKKKISCSICGKCYTKNVLQQHMRKVHEPKVTCEHCGKKIGKESLKTHIEFYHEGVRKYECNICHKSLSTSKGLRTHIQVVHEEKHKQACTVCGKILKGRLNMHMRKHTGEKPCVCELCPARFSNPKSLEAHIIHRHKEKGEVYSCNICGEGFFNKFLLKKHIHDVHTLKDFSEEKLKDISEEAKAKIVELLEKENIFKVAERMQLPVRVLTIWKSKRLCPICGKNVNHRNLETHIERHQTEDQPRSVRKKEKKVKKVKSYLCSICGKQLSSAGRLKNHINIHQKEREIAEYAASHGYAEAGMKFEIDPVSVRRCYQLIFHPIQCDLCEYQAPWQSSMKKHIRNVHEVTNDFKCDLCNYECSSQKKLDFHLKISHRNTKVKARLKKKTAVSSVCSREVDPKLNETILEKIRSLQFEVSDRTTAPFKTLEDLRSNSGIEETLISPDEPEENETLHTLGGDSVESEEVDNDQDSNIETEAIKVEGLEIEEGWVESEVEDYPDNVDMVDDDFENTENYEDENNEDIDDPGIPEIEREGQEELTTKVRECFVMIRKLSSNQLENASNQEEPNPEDYSWELMTKIEEEEEEGEYESVLEEVKSLASEDLEMFKNILETDAVEKEKMDFEEKSNQDERKKKEAKKGKTKAAPKTEMVLDLSKYGLDEESTEFVIKSDYVDDQELMTVLRTKKYKGKSRVFQCSTCEKRFPNRYNMRIHLEVHSEDKTFQCDLCPSTFKLQSYLRKHINFKHDTRAKTKTQGENSVQCNHCGKMLRNKFSLKQHIAAKHEGQYKHTCEVCGNKFMKTHLYETHMKVHDGSVVISCEICGGHFANYNSLKAHQMLVHEGIRTIRKVYTYPCSDCGKIFKDKNSCESHVRIVHEGITDSFECSFCHKKFGRKSSLNAHILLHTGEFKKFDCELCSASYKEKRNLLNHVKKNHADQF